MLLGGSCVRVYQLRKSTPLAVPVEGILDLHHPTKVVDLNSTIIAGNNFALTLLYITFGSLQPTYNIG